MKKIAFLFFLIIVIFFLSCKTQRVTIIEAKSDNGLEPTKCYFSVLKEKKELSEQKKDRSFLLEITPPKYKKIEVKYTEDQLEQHLQSDGNYQFQTTEFHFQFIFKNKQIKEFTDIENPEGYIYCMVEVPIEYQFFSKEELTKKENIIVEKRMVESSKLVKRYIKNRPINLTKNQRYFTEGYWTILKEAINHNHGGSISILAVKRKLIELGYELIENNIIDRDTKNALIDFQKKNNLKEGQLDFETLEKLGVSY